MAVPCFGPGNHGHATVAGLRMVDVALAPDPPTRDELVRGMTVGIERSNGDRIVGEIGAVISSERTHPDGFLVKLKFDARGRVKRFRPDV